MKLKLNKSNYECDNRQKKNSITDSQNSLTSTITSEHIGDYVLKKELGKGAFGTVNIAVKNEGGTLRKYAIKRFQNAVTDSKIAASYDNEWKKLELLREKNLILNFIEKLDYNGSFCIVTEYFEVCFI